MLPFNGIAIELSPLVPDHHWAGFAEDGRVIALGGKGWHFSPPGGLGIVRVKVGRAVWDAINEETHNGAV